MTWAQFASNWNVYFTVLLRHFPYATPKALEQARIGPTALSRVIAESHDLTEPEAREELDNFLALQSLARVALDMRAQDAGLVSVKSG